MGCVIGKNFYNWHYKVRHIEHTYIFISISAFCLAIKIPNIHKTTEQSKHCQKMTKGFISKQKISILQELLHMAQNIEVMFA